MSRVIATHPVVVNDFSDHCDRAGMGTSLEEDYASYLDEALEVGVLKAEHALAPS